MTPTAFLGLLIVLTALLGWLFLLFEAIEPLVWRGVRWVAGRGWVRASATLARLCRRSFHHDPRGGQALAGALALLARPAHDERLATWLEGQLGKGASIGAADVVAAGLVAASRGQREAARDLMNSAASFEAESAPGPARVVANEWLVADAADRGDWPTVMRLGVRPHVASPQTRFLAFAAARVRREPLIDEASATDLGLRWLWWRSPDRQRARPLLQQALAAPRILHARRPTPRPVPPPPPLDPAEYAGDPLAYAQALHALWSAAPEVERSLTPTHLGDLCRAWDSAFAGPMRAHLAARTQALTSMLRAEDAVNQIRRTVSEELASLARRAGIPLAGLGESGIGAEAATLLRAELLAEVEQKNQALRARTLQKRSLPAVEEMREWNALRRAYEQAALLGGLEVRRLMFPDIHLYVCNYAVWLWNERKEYGMSGPLFRWLLAEAEAVGDEEAITLQRKNVLSK